MRWPTPRAGATRVEFQHIATVSGAMPRIGVVIGGRAVGTVQSDSAEAALVGALGMALRDIAFTIEAGQARSLADFDLAWPT